MTIEELVNIIKDKYSCLEETAINIDLTSKTALVCGASKGIGKAVAFELASLGANVILLARTESELKKIVAELPGPGKHEYFALDVSDHKLLKETIESFVEKNGPVHILINNTGGPKGGLIAEATGEEFLSAFHNHVLVNSLLTQILLPGMKSISYGRIINIISTSVKIPIPNLGVSNTIRAAVANWAKTLSVEVAPFGITVNNVLPGYTDTERLLSLMQATADRTGKSLDQVINEWKNTIPMGRFADPAETASAVAFLASPASSYISGINLPVDGGRTGCL